MATGSCLCGKVHYAISGNLGIFQYCHCSRCRKFTGSAYGANLIVAAADFKWTAGEKYVGRFELENAKRFATQFCTQCGSSLPWLSKTKEVVVVPTGTLDDDPEIRPTQNIYWDSRACWYVEADALPKHAELPKKA